MWSWRFVCTVGGREVVVGVRFTLVRLAPLNIPGIPTSGMLGTPLSSPCTSGAVEGFYVGSLTPAGPLDEQKPHTL